MQYRPIRFVTSWGLMDSSSGFATFWCTYVTDIKETDSEETDLR